MTEAPQTILVSESNQAHADAKFIADSLYKAFGEFTGNERAGFMVVDPSIDQDALLKTLEERNIAIVPAENVLDFSIEDIPSHDLVLTGYGSLSHEEKAEYESMVRGFSASPQGMRSRIMILSSELPRTEVFDGKNPSGMFNSRFRGNVFGVTKTDQGTIVVEGYKTVGPINSPLREWTKDATKSKRFIPSR